MFSLPMMFLRISRDLFACTKIHSSIRSKLFLIGPLQVQVLATHQRSECGLELDDSSIERKIQTGKKFS